MNPELTPPIIGELVGCDAAARVTGDYTGLYTLLTELHRDGYTPAVLGKAIGVQARTIKAMVRAGQAGSTG